MKIKTSQAINSIEILDRYAAKAVVTNPKLYRMLARVQRELLKVSETHEKEKNLLVRSLGKVDDRGQIQIAPDKLREHGEKLYEYLAEPVFVAIPGHIPFEMLEAASIQPTSIELSILDWLILWNDHEDEDFVTEPDGKKE